jgi:MFS family permease
VTARSLSPGLMAFAVASTIKAAGTGFYYPFSLLFFTEVLNTSYATIGAVLTVSNFVALPLLPFIGRIVDRSGGKTALISSLVVRAAGFVVVIVWPSISMFVLVAVLNALAARVDAVATQLLCIELPRDEGDFPRWLAMFRSTFNLGFGIGTLAAGLLVSIDRNVIGGIGFVVAAGFLVAAGIYLTLTPARRPAHEAPPGRLSGEPESLPARRRPMDGRYVLLTVVSSIASAAGLLLESLLAPYLLAHTSAPAWLAGVLIALNTALLALLFVPLEGTISRRRQVRALRLSCILILVGLVALPAVGTTHVVPPWAAAVVLAVGILVYSAGELVSTQVLGVLLTALPEPSRRGSALSFGQLVGGVVAAGVPWVSGLILDSNSPWLWVAVLAPVLASILVTFLRGIRQSLDKPVSEIVRTNVSAST